VTRIGFEDTTQIRKDWLLNARRVRQWMKSSKRCSLLCIALVLTHGWPNKRSQGTLPIEDQYIYIYIYIYIYAPITQINIYALLFIFPLKKKQRVAARCYWKGEDLRS